MLLESVLGYGAHDPFKLLTASDACISIASSLNWTVKNSAEDMGMGYCCMSAKVSTWLLMVYHSLNRAILVEQLIYHHVCTLGGFTSDRSEENSVYLLRLSGMLGSFLPSDDCPEFYA